MQTSGPAAATFDLAILGGGGHGSDVLAIVEALESGSDAKKSLSVVVADDDWSKPSRFTGRRVELLSSTEEAIRSANSVVIGIGYPESRRLVRERSEALGASLCSPLFHPSAQISCNSEFGSGAVVFGNVWVSPGCEVGANTHVMYGATIGHDVVVGQDSTVMPGANISGDSCIGPEVLVGAGSVVLQGISVGSGSTIGAGAVVTRDVAPGTTVVGAPARPLGPVS